MSRPTQQVMLTDLPNASQNWHFARKVGKNQNSCHFTGFEEEDTTNKQIQRSLEYGRFGCISLSVD
jgi:hypothetical protein